MPKLLLLGWDAADWQIIKPLMEAGHMPCLKRLMDKAAYGNLASLQPMISPMLWTSIATGKRPYKHGIHGFVEWDDRAEKAVPVRTTKRTTKALWNMLSEAGVHTQVVNWWPSSPVEEVNGVYLSNAFHRDAPAPNEAWPLTDEVIHPKHYLQKIADLRLHPAEISESMMQPFFPNLEELDPQSDPIVRSAMRILAHTVSIHAAATEFMAEGDWDFNALYFEGLDHASHLGMKFRPPQLAGVSEEEVNKYGDLVNGFYRFHDMMLERYIELGGPDLNILLVSDHGFHSASQRIAKLPDLPAAPALEHRRQGVFLAHGPLFKAGEYYGLSLLDICPTVLHAFGLPIGEDMDGKARTDLFRQPSPISRISSWDHTASPLSFRQAGQNNRLDTSILNQLEELGYLQSGGLHLKSRVNNELRYNLIQSLTDGRAYEEALKETEKLIREEESSRAVQIALHLSYQLGRTGAFEAHLARLQELLGQGHPELLYFGALKALMEGHLSEAEQKLQALEGAGVVSLQLYLQLAETFYHLQQWKLALSYAGKALNLDGESPLPLVYLGLCYFQMEQDEKAIEALLKAVSLQFFNPEAHFALAQLFLRNGREEEAKSAVAICLKQAPKHAGALRMTGRAKMEAKDSILLVSGLPRSGTSMLMQMLHAGGVEILSDHIRKSDDHNPKGYFEDERVKRLPQDQSWLEEAKGKALKVVSPLLKFLPGQHHYKIILLHRPLLEVILSQEKMKGRSEEEGWRNFPFQMAVDFEREEANLRKWIARQPNMELLELDYAQCIQNPADTAQQLARFIHFPLDEKRASEAVDPALYRNKLKN